MRVVACAFVADQQSECPWALAALAACCWPALPAACASPCSIHRPSLCVTQHHLASHRHARRRPSSRARSRRARAPTRRWCCMGRAPPATRAPASCTTLAANQPPRPHAQLRAGHWWWRSSLRSRHRPTRARTIRRPLTRCRVGAPRGALAPRADCFCSPQAAPLQSLPAFCRRVPCPCPPQITGPSVPTCPGMPVITCPYQPACTAPGTVVQLAGTCTAGDPTAVLVYYINGASATNATCPATGTNLVVTVGPAYPALPGCSYNTTTAYNLTSAPPGLAGLGWAGLGWAGLGWAGLGQWGMQGCFQCPGCWFVACPASRSAPLHAAGMCPAPS